MPTPKFNRICLDFMQRIGYATSESNGVVQGGDVLTTAGIETYINRAQLKVFHDVWAQVGGDLDKFIAILPELLSTPTSVTFTSGIYTIASPLKDLFKLYNAIDTTLGNQIGVLPAEFYPVLKLGLNTNYKPSSSNQFLVQMGNGLYGFPDTISSGTITYIRVPLSPSTGDYIRSGGTDDTPYSEIWSSIIAEEAEKLFRATIQI